MDWSFCDVILQNTLLLFLKFSGEELFGIANQMDCLFKFVVCNVTKQTLSRS